MNKEVKGQIHLSESQEMLICIIIEYMAKIWQKE